MQSVSPVFTQDEVMYETEIAKNQSEYLAVIGLPVSLQIVDRESKQVRVLQNWGTAIRFRLNDSERAAIARGDDLVITQLNFGKPITPLNLQVCAENSRPVFGQEVELPSVEEITAYAEPTQEEIDLKVQQFCVCSAEEFNSDCPIHGKL